MKKYMAIFALLFFIHQMLIAQDDMSKIFNAVVKLEVKTSTANIGYPWKNNEGGGVGTGAVIADRKILTCAHCIADSTFIRVRKPNEESIFKAKVEFVDHDCDLALLLVDDDKFMNDIIPMQIGETPDEQSEVVAIGYPIGGNNLSFTRGIVSRIEEKPYSHSKRSLPVIQVDAAINPGNSGGPVLDMRSMKLCGIAFQGDKRGEALGQIIPTEVINHFLADTDDGEINGFCDFPLRISILENEGTRRYLKMAENQTGVLVQDVKSTATNSLQIGDVLLEIDGYKIANNNYIRLKNGKKHDCTYPMLMRQLGEKIPAKVLRHGEIINTEIPVMKENLRIRGWLYDKTPDYYVFGGMIFSTLSFNLISVVAKPYEDILKVKDFADDEIVMLTDILADDVVEGYIGEGGKVIRSVNGIKIHSLRQLADYIDNCHDEFLKFALDDGDKYDDLIIVDTQKLRDATPRILKTYRIPADRSNDLK